MIPFLRCIPKSASNMEIICKKKSSKSFISNAITGTFGKRVQFEKCLLGQFKVQYRRKKVV